MKKISVIVPIYKVENYLSQCVESIINQTYQHLEIILVDDGSPDRCPQICDEYALKDKRIRVIHKENGGLSSARNSGLDIATGDFVAFVDSDDWLDREMYQNLINVLNETQADISVCRFRREKEMKEGSMDNHSTKTITMFNDYDDMCVHLLSSSKPSISFMVWNKLFRREVISDTRFIEGQIYEDMYFDRNVLKRCAKLAFLDWEGYHYRVGRPGSTATFFKIKKINKFNEINKYIESFEKTGNKNAIAKFRLYGLMSAIELYLSAWDNDADGKIKSEILHWFRTYSDKPQPHSLRLSVFSISPNLYCYIFKTLKKIKELKFFA